MDIADIVWHVGALVVAVWACLGYFSLRRRNEFLEKVLLPALAAGDALSAAKPAGQSLLARGLDFCVKELERAFECRVRTELHAMQGHTLSVSETLWPLVNLFMASRTNESPAFLFEAQSVNSSQLREQLNKRKPRTIQLSLLAQPNGGRQAQGPAWKVDFQ